MRTILVFLVHFEASIEEKFGILALFQALIADNLGIIKILGKNKHHSGLEPYKSLIILYTVLYLRAS